MDDTAVMIVIGFVVFGLFSTVFTLRFLTKRKIKETEEARTLAALLGLHLLEPAEAMRRSFEVSGQTAVLARLEKLPAPIMNFLRDNASWIMEGEKGGVPVTIYTETRSSGRSTTTYTVVRASYPKALLFDLHLSREGQLTKLGKALFGLKDIQIGDDELDPLVRIKASDADAVRGLFRKPVVREALLSALSIAPRLSATRTHVDWERVGSTADPAVITPILEAILPLAKALGS